MFRTVYTLKIAFEGLRTFARGGSNELGFKSSLKIWISNWTFKLEYYFAHTGQKNSKNVPNCSFDNFGNFDKGYKKSLVKVFLNCQFEIQILDGICWLYPCKWDKNACRLSALHVCNIMERVMIFKCIHRWIWSIDGDNFKLANTHVRSYKDSIFL